MRWIRNRAILIDMILFSDVAIEDLQCTGESLLAAIFGLKQCSQNVRNEKNAPISCREVREYGRCTFDDHSLIRHLQYLYNHLYNLWMARC